MQINNTMDVTDTTRVNMTCPVISTYTNSSQLANASTTGSTQLSNPPNPCHMDASIASTTPAKKMVAVHTEPSPVKKKMAGTVPTPVVACVSPSIKLEFSMKWNSFTWQDTTGVQNVISADVPPIVNTFCVSTTDGISHEYCAYKQGGTNVSYDITTLPVGVPYDTKSQTNPYLQAPNAVPVDTFKINFFTKRAPTVVTAISLDPTIKPPAVTRPNNLSVFLAGGWVGLSELAQCMKGNAGGIVLTKEFSHNFTPMSLHVQFSEAVVTIDGVRHTDGPTLLTALSKHLKSGRIEPSMMPSMHNRSQVLVASAKIIGASTSNMCQLRKNSIGHLMYQPLSLGLQQGEVIPISMMGDLYKSYIQPVCCPVMGVHFTAHAMNICALPAWNADVGPPLLMGTNSDIPVTPPRRYSTREVLNVLHTSLQGPTYSAELVPYTSDVVLCISKPTVEKMRAGTFSEFSQSDFVPSEMIDSCHSVPDGLECFRAQDCEGSAALSIKGQHDIRASFYDTADMLSKCNTTAGSNALVEWVQSKQFCNVDITSEKAYAFAVNMAVVGAVSHMAVDTKLLIIGAMCATPLVPIEMTQEQGHAACMARVNMKAVECTIAAVYEHYDNPKTRFLLLKLPALDGVRAMGRPTDATGVHLAGEYSMDTPSVTLQTPPTNFVGFTGANTMPLGCSVLKPSFDDNYPCINVTPTQQDNTPCYEFQIVESTTSLHSCPVNGYISAARMNAVKTSTGKHNAVPSVTGVPVEQFLKAVQVSFIQPYLGISEDVRLQGFTHAAVDPEMPSTGAIKTPQFYNTFYQMDTFALNTVQKDGSILVGAEASVVLNNSHNSDVCTTMEPTSIPILSAAENIDLKNAMQKQWKEARLPSIGIPKIRAMLASWHPATICNVYCPDNEVEGIIRCNVAISGEHADKLFTDMGPGGPMHMAEGGGNNGMVAQQHAIRMGRCTTIASQAVRTKHFTPVK